MRIKGKKPTVRQKRILDAKGFNPDFCLVYKDTPLDGDVNRLHVIDKESGDSFTVFYNRSNPFEEVL